MLAELAAAVRERTRHSIGENRQAGTSHSTVRHPFARVSWRLPWVSFIAAHEHTHDKQMREIDRRPTEVIAHSKIGKFSTHHAGASKAAY